MYRVSLAITTKMGTKITDWIAKSADALGADGIWIGEDINVGQDVSVLAASVLLQSQRVRVGTGIIPIAPHSIASIVRSTLALSEMGKGRYVLGIGIGGIQDLERLGIQVRKPVTELKEATLTLRELLAGRSVSRESELVHLNNYRLRLQEEISVPIFFGVRGPQMLALAGEMANGVILSGPFDYLSKAVEVVNSAAKRANRNPQSVEKVVWLPTVPTFKGMKEHTARRIVALIVADTPDPVMDMLSLDKKQLVEIRNVVSAKGARAGVPLVTDDILDAFSISGSKKHMIDRFEQIAEIGATELVLGPPYSGEWKVAIKELMSEIITRREVA